MPHIVIDLDFSTHPKIVKLDPLSQLLFLRSLQYAGKHLTDGFIPKEAIPLLTYDFIPYLRITATILAKQKHNLDNLDHNLDNPDHNLDHNLADLAGVLIDQLTRKIGDKNNLWITQEDGWVIHDYLDWQWSKREVEEFKERRAETSRKNGHLGGRPKKNLDNLEKPAKQVRLGSEKHNPAKPRPNLEKPVLSPPPPPPPSDSDSPSDSEIELETKRIKDSTGAGCGFEEFWKAYPKKVGKENASRSWDRTKKDRPNLEALLLKIADQKQSEQWRRDAGQYIPNPATWLNQHRWKDEGVEALPPMKPKPKSMLELLA